MESSKLQVYDPPMCCSSGVCGPNVNPELVRFSSDLDWLRRRGVKVERYNLSSHPAAFAEQEAVREALKNEGNDCLPLIVVNDRIVSNRIYPTRSDLMKLSGIESEKVRMEATQATASSVELENETAACGPGCSCATPSGSTKIKVMVSLIVLLAVGGIFAFKASSAKQKASNNIATQGDSTFAVVQAAPSATPSATPVVEVQSSSVTEQNKTEKTALPEVKPIIQNATASAPAKAGWKIGEYLESLSALNKVAINQDAVCVFIPAPKSEMADDKTNDAVLAAQRTLKRSNITLGLYTLLASSADYSAMSAQVQPPAILIAVKGKGMSAVSGDVTETKLLQAFVASSSAGGCGPSGCGPSGAASCN